MRCWPQNNAETLSFKHINGAYTYRHDGDIFVFRDEEYPKVLLHEMLHHSIYDPISEPAFAGALRDIEAYLKSLLPQITSPILVNEGIVEAMATWLHAHFIAADTHMPFISVWIAERRWATHQAIRLVSRIDAAAAQKTTWSEETNAVAYLIVRAVCLLSFDECRKILERENANPEALSAFFQKYAKDTVRLLRGLRRIPRKNFKTLRMTHTGVW